MDKYNLGFISEEKIFNHVKSTVEKYRFDINLNSFNSNLIDPIKLTFDSKIYKKSIKEVIDDEIIRQIDKSNTNHIGYFHQNLFKYLSSDWHLPTKNFDVINEKLRFFVEIKNKHNTMNARSSQKTYMIMMDKILKDPQATCALVEIIAKNSQNIPWKISIDGKQMFDERIRRISIDKFYEIVTGDKFAFKKLCEKLHIIIDDVVKSGKIKRSSNTVLKELGELSSNFLKSLYLFSFKKYEGFDNFDLYQL